MELIKPKAGFMTPTEIAQLLKSSRSNVYQLCERGLLVAHRIGAGRGCIRVARVDLEAYLESVRRLPRLPIAARRQSTPRRRPELFKHMDVSRLPSARS
jgi:excisionase family DNA binding protein